MYQHGGRQRGSTGTHGQREIDCEQAHNPKVAGSNPAPATNESPGRSQDLPGLLRVSGAIF